MRIAIDASSILPPCAGIGRYTLELTRALAAARHGHELILLLNSLRRATPAEPFLRAPNIRIVRKRIPGPLLLAGWRFFHVPHVERLIGPVDAFHSPAGYLPPQRNGARVATIHDLHFLKRPEHAHWLGGGWLRATLPRQAARWTRIISPCQTVRRNLIECLGVSPEQVCVVPHGVDLDHFRPPEDPTKARGVRRALGLPSQYILFVGTLEPRKNLPALIEAWAYLARGDANLPPLVLAGRPGWKWRAIHEPMARLKLRIGRDVFLLGGVSDDELPALYGGALLFVLPSLEEGFGLTLLEAMSCGAPCVISPAEALSELSGGAAHQAKGFDAEALADAMRHMLESPGRLRELSAAGRRRAREFPWDRCARMTMSVYEEAAACAPRPGISH